MTCRPVDSRVPWGEWQDPNDICVGGDAPLDSTPPFLSGEDHFIAVGPPGGPAVVPHVIATRSIFAPAESRPAIPNDIFVEQLVEGLFRTPAGEPNPIPNLRVTGEVELPFLGKTPRGTFVARARVVFAEGGRIEVIRAGFEPTFGRIPFFSFLPLQDVPIIGPIVSVDLKGAHMDPKSRELKVEGRFSLYSGEIDGGERLFDALEIPEELRRDNRVPERLSQLFRLLLNSKKLKEQKPGAIPGGKPILLPIEVQPLWKKGEIRIEGDFSNRTVEVNLETDPNLPALLARKVRLIFSNVPEGRHRLVIKGNLTNPTIEVQGLQAVEYVHPSRVVRVENDISDGRPLTMSVKFDPQSMKPPYFTLNWRQDFGMRIRELSGDRQEELSTIELPRGGLVEGFQVTLENSVPEISIERVLTEELHYQGHGLDFHTAPGAEGLPIGEARPVRATSLTDVSLKMSRGMPVLSGTLSGSVDGSLNYSREGREQGAIEFRPVEGKGRFHVGPLRDDAGRESGPFEISIKGEVKAMLPSVRLNVENEAFHGRVMTDIENANVSAIGELTLIPKLESFNIVSDRPNGVQLRAERARVLFEQDTFLLVPELARTMTEEDRKTVKSQLHMEALPDPESGEPGIQFVTHRMNLVPTRTERGSALRIVESDLANIAVHGNLWGQAFFFHVPTGFVIPFQVREDAMMKGARIEVAGLRDQRGSNGVREIYVGGIELEGVESIPTLSPEEQRRCGFEGLRDRQHIHVSLGLFGFHPATREIKVERVGEHFHVNLIDPVTRGCIRLGVVKR